MICKVYQGSSPSSLLLVDHNDMVINGHWHLSHAFQNGNPITLVGFIDFHGDYNDSLDRFREGERVMENVCPCCNQHISWDKINE